MSSRRLLSNSSRSASRSQQPSRGGERPSDEVPEMPEYEPLEFPLNTQARRALRELSSNQDTGRYAKQLKDSVGQLSDSVRDINDRYTLRREKLRNQQEKRAAAGEGTEKKPSERAEEKAVMMLKGEVPGLTKQCDEAVRAVIDMQVELADSKAALEAAVQEAEEESKSAEQIIRSQRERREQQRQAREAEEAGEEPPDEDEDMADADAEPPRVRGALPMLAQGRKNMTDEYKTKSLYEKYAINNDYIRFKSLWHDAMHGDDGKPLPDATRWFTQHGAAGGDDDEAEDDEDEDLIIAEENISLHCPLSMQVMREPYTSRKCHHTFDLASIKEFLVNKRQSKTCPQTGCSEQISMQDLYADDIVLRKIQRARGTQSKRHAHDDEDEDHEMEDGDGPSMMIERERTVKSERGRDRGQRLVDSIVDEA